MATAACCPFDKESKGVYLRYASRRREEREGKANTVRVGVQEDLQGGHRP